MKRYVSMEFREAPLNVLFSARTYERNLEIIQSVLAGQTYKGAGQPYGLSKEHVRRIMVKSARLGLIVPKVSAT